MTSSERSIEPYAAGVTDRPATNAQRPASLDGGAGPSAHDARPRVHRVTLCAMVFAEVDVTATSPAEAMQLAEKSSSAARRTFRTAPAAHRVRIQEMVDWRRPDLGTRWVDITPFAA